MIVKVKPKPKPWNIGVIALVATLIAVAIGVGIYLIVRNRNSTSCKNGGEYKDSKCICPTGFTGDDCGTSVPTPTPTPTPCDRCKNGSTCVDSGSGSSPSSVCVCTPGWKGPTCEERVIGDECVGIDCGSFGKCDPVTATCKCIDTSYTGSRCEIDLNKCRNVNCGQAGICAPETGRCICLDSDYTGTNCEILVNMCKFQSCKPHGTCDPETGKCRCDSTHTGPNCEILINRCGEINCGEFGTCQMVPSASGGSPSVPTCVCRLGYTGTRCDIRPNKCLNVDCTGNGFCDSNTGSCVCKYGYTGSRCEIKTSPCMGVQCGANGSCDTNTGRCICTGGYSGAACETAPSPCLTFKCLNRGECKVVSPTLARCICPSPYIGRFCEVDSSQSFRYGQLVYLLHVSQRALTQPLPYNTTASGGASGTLPSPQLVNLIESKDPITGNSILSKTQMWRLTNRFTNPSNWREQFGKTVGSGDMVSLQWAHDETKWLNSYSDSSKNLSCGPILPPVSEWSDSAPKQGIQLVDFRGLLIPLNPGYLMSIYNYENRNSRGTGSDKKMDVCTFEGEGGTGTSIPYITTATSTLNVSWRMYPAQ